MEIRELNKHHVPAAFTFVKVTVRNQMLFRAVIGSVPSPDGRPHRV
jgi:hypothetical protein